MTRFARKFGITKPMTFDGITTVAGNYDLTDSGRLSFCWSGIGQHTDLINPARYLTFVGAVAAGGDAAEPYVVEEVRADGRVTYRARTSDTGRLVSRSTAKTLQELMRYNVTYKYGAQNFPGLTVCAKSGTAETGSGDTDALFAKLLHADLGKNFVITDFQVADTEHLFTGFTVRFEVRMESCSIETVRGLDLFHMFDLF
jgi:cell division protein FtsI/penicillin-binding protein 2